VGDDRKETKCVCLNGVYLVFSEGGRVEMGMRNAYVSKSFAMLLQTSPAMTLLQIDPYKSIFFRTPLQSYGRYGITR
jgi:hypothetical protein